MPFNDAEEEFMKDYFTEKLLPVLKPSGSKTLKRVAAPISFFILFTCSFTHVTAQSCIQGKVINAETGKALAEASITVSGVNATTSDKNGDFRICNLRPDSVTLSVSYIGFETLKFKSILKPGENLLPDFSISPVAINMNELVVTATRTGNKILNTPVRVNLISPRMLSNAPMHSIDEVMKFAPGINYSRPFGIYSTKGIVTMRGMSGKEQGRVLVLIDGVPINKSDGGTVDWNMIDINSVQKIEITKGAGSAIYGGNAMGGIINILSKKPGEKTFVNASVEYGTYNTFGGKAGTGGTVKVRNPENSWYWMASIYAKQSDGYITQSEADVKANPYIVKSNMKEAGANFKTGYSFNSKHSLEATVNYYNDKRGTGEKVYQPEGNTTDHDSYGTILNYHGLFNTLKINSSAYFLTENYKKVNEYLRDDYTWYDVLSKRRDIGWFTTLTAPLGKGNLVTGGFDYKNGSVDAYDKYYTSTDIVYNKGRMNTYALFAQDEISLLEDKIRLIAGLRFDMAQYYDGAFYIENPSMETEFMVGGGYEEPDMPTQNWSEVSPRFSMQYKWNPNGRVYAMYSHGFRPSVLDDLCRSGRIKGGFKVANPALQPESLNNYETGFDIRFIEKVSLAGSVYYSRGSDFQYYISNGETIDMGFGERPIFIRANISDVEMYGAEAEIRYDILPSLTAFANYAYTHSTILTYNKITETDTIDLAGKFFTDVPPHIFSAGANWNNRMVNISALMHYNGSMYINDQNIVDEVMQSDKYAAYTTVDLKLWKAFKTHYKLSLDVQNLFDVKYYDSKYSVCPGRFITAKFEVNF